jgi:hypothetical protein
MEVFGMPITPNRVPSRVERSQRWLLNGKRSISAAILLAVVIPNFARAEYREVEVKDAGTITGKVSFHAELPEDAVETYPISGKWPGCGTGYREIITIDTEGGALRGVFVLLDEVAAGKKWPEGSFAAKLDQTGCRFVPAYQVVRSGATMTIRNSDTGVLHNVNMREIVEVPGGRTVRRMMFNIAQPVVGEVEQKIKPRKSPFLTVGCDLHNFMFAHVVAPEHPYAVLVNDDGTFLIDDVPPGGHSVIAWHPRLGQRAVSVTVPANGTAEASFEFGK